jgi:hypothetical protein
VQHGVYAASNNQGSAPRPVPSTGALRKPTTRQQAAIMPNSRLHSHLTSHNVTVALLLMLRFQWFTVAAYFTVASLCHKDVSRVANVSQVYAATTFRAMSVTQVSVHIYLAFGSIEPEKDNGWCPVWANRERTWKNYLNGTT